MKIIIEIPKEVKQEFDKIESIALKGAYFDLDGIIGKAIKNGIPLDDIDSDETRAYFDGQAYGWEQGRKALIDDVKADSNFLNLLVNVIPPNEMEKYRDMYNCSGEKNNC